MIFEVTFNFPAQNNGAFPGKTSTYSYTLEQAVYDMECEGFGDHDNEHFSYRDGMRYALTAVLRGMTIGTTLTIPGDTHQGYYIEPVVMTRNTHRIATPLQMVPMLGKMETVKRTQSGDEASCDIITRILQPTKCIIQMANLQGGLSQRDC